MEHTEKTEEHTLTENLSAVGQIVLGEVQKIGGILTGDPITNAEGEFNIGAGAAHQEVNREIAAGENVEADKNPDND
ncbi:MAG: hypothetical protein ABI954_10630 [Pyrinomonadaceae bacterium]